MLTFLVFVLSPQAVVHASPPASSVPFCRVFDYEEWRRDHPRPAAKRLADLNVGEPRTVRMIYFLPNDRPFRQDVVDSMRAVIRQVQTFYAEQMQAHGYGNTTFRIETDVQGEPMVHRVDGQHPDSHYLDVTGIVHEEIDQVFDLDENIYLFVVDNSTDLIGVGDGRVAGGTGGGYKKAGSALVPGPVDFTTVAHELGHAFGLQHDFRDDAYIMSYGSGQRRSLSACHAEFLAVHPYFNDDSSLESDWEGRPTAELISPRAYPAGSESVSIQLKIGDSAGLHQVILFAVTRDVSAAAGGPEVKACRGLAGEKDTVVEFEYDGAIPSSFASSLSNPGAHPIRVAVVDTDGDVTRMGFVLAEISPHLVATLEGYTGPVHSVVFSPDGATLASGSVDGVRLWDVSAREEIATLEGQWYPSSVVFSPDGATLASGSADRTVRLWDVSAREEIATLKHTHAVESMAISFDGTTLASGSRDGTVRLWDVASREEMAALEGHTDPVHSVVFSPDGATLASGSWDTVRLWDVGAREEIATLEGHWNTSVAFSSDGATLASGYVDGMVRLWDVSAREEIATLEGHTTAVHSVVFSPDGATLASGSVDGMVRLWDVPAREEIADLGHPDGIRSMSFSPDGATLAAGSEDAILLWDVSEWTGRPRPSALEIISGDDQQGSPGAALAHPLIVEVRDQYGDPLPEATVTFRVTAGGGKLRDRSRVEHVSTDANGRAERILTLGPHPGTNTVGVSIGGRDLATFHAQGVGTTVTARGEGDYRTWHLPDGAMARLGKGALSYSDRGVALSPDGRCLAVASAIGVWLYEVATARGLALLPTEGAVLAMALSPGGTTLASGLDNGGIELWEVETATRIATLEGREGYRGWVTSVVFSPDGATLAAGAADGMVSLWDVAARERIATLEGDGHWINSLVFSPDGATLAAGAQGRSSIRLWDVSAREESDTLEGDGCVTSVVFSPDGATLASGDRNGIKLWDVSSREEIATLEGRGVESVVFSSDGAILASGDWDGMVKLWDVSSREEIATLEGHTDGVESVAISSDGATVVSGLRNGTVWLWDVASREEIASLGGHWGKVSSVVFSPDGAILASGSLNGTVRLWDVVAREEIASLKGPAQAVVFSPDGASLASAGGAVRLWDVSAREEIATLEGHGGGIIGGINSVVFSPDGTTLAWGSFDGTIGTIRLWDVSARAEVATLEGHRDRVTSIAIPPGGTTLASGSEDGTIRLWDVGSRAEIATLLKRRFNVNSVGFSPDGATLASGGQDKTVRLWDVASREEIATLGHTSSVKSVVFSPDGATLVSGSWDGTVKLWDVAAREEIASLKGPARYSDLPVVISPDGTILASGSSDGTVLLWDMQRLQPHPQIISKLSGDGQEGQPNATLDEPFVVVVRDQNGDPFEGAEVTFAVTADGGALSVLTAITDAQGRASSTLTLGRQPGPNTIEVTVAGLAPVTFTAVGVAVPRTLAKHSGDGQQAAAGALLAESLVVSVQDQNGDPFEGAEVTFAVTAGGGALSVLTAITDAQGRASSTLTLGRQPGPNTIEVTVAGLAPVTFTAVGVAVPRTLAKHSGDGQQAAAGALLAEPLVVSVRDQNGSAYPGAVVTFAVLGDGSVLSAASDTTDAEGQAATILTLGEEWGTYTVVATVADLEPVTFIATAKATPDFDGDGVTDFSDFFLFAEHFGGSDPRFDLDNSGSVDFADFFLFAEHFGQPARAKLVAIARELIGLPDGPQLRQNAPNPFNSRTVISWFQLEPGLAHLEVFALTGQRVAVLHEGPKRAGLHRLRWDGRDERGRLLASGVYVYRLVTSEAVQTRKLTLLR